MQNKLSLLIFAILALALSAALGFAGYWWFTNQGEKKAEQQTSAMVSKAAALVNGQFAQWQSASADINTMPAHAPQGATMRLLPAEGIPTDLSYSEQDLLARSRYGNTGAEVTSSQTDTKTTQPEQSYSIIKPLLTDEFLLLRFSLTPLEQKLAPLVATNQHLTLSQTVNNQTASAIGIHANKSTALEKYALNDAQWSIGASYDVPKAAISPKHIGLGIFALFALLTTAPLFLKYQKLNKLDKELAAKKEAEAAAKKARKQARNDQQTTPIDTEALPLEPVGEQNEPMATPQPIDPLLAAKQPLDEDMDEATKDIFAELDSETKSDEAKEDGLEFETSNETPPQATDPQTQSAYAELDSSNMIEYDASKGYNLDTTTRKLFKAYDIRGDATLINDTFISALASAFAKVFRQNDVNEVVIGHDTRKTGSDIAHTLINGLLGQGISVLDIGLASTPMMAFAAKENKGAGIMVTASHSSDAHNGFKWLINNQSPTSEQIGALSLLCEEQPASVDTQGQHYLQPYQQPYLDAIAEDIILADLLTVGIDCMHGATAIVAPELFETVGCIVESHNTNTDGEFTSGQPDPIAQDRLTQFCAHIASSDCNIGFAFDADGDRLAVVDDDGSLITSEQLICLFAQMLLETNPSADILFDSKCSRMVNQAISDAGGCPQRLPTGSAHLRRALFSARYQAVFAGELSGHFIFNDDRLGTHDDALYAALRLCEWLTQKQSTLSELVARLPKRINSQDHYISHKQKQEQESIITTLIANWQQSTEHGAHVLDTTDGFRLDSPTGFGIIRQSNTSEQLNFRFSATNTDGLHSISQLFIKLVEPIDAELAEQINTLVSAHT